MANKYSNFVRPESPAGAVVTSTPTIPFLDGKVAKKLYLDEVKDVCEFKSAASHNVECNILHQKPKSNLKRDIEVSDKNLFLTVQNDEVGILKMVLDKNPDKILIQDDFGWTLLMIACQANAVESVKELLKRDVDTTVRDKAGNSAQSLVIRNRNLALVDLLLEHKSRTGKSSYPNIQSSSPDAKSGRIHKKHKKVKSKDDFVCDICKNRYSNKEEHLLSTVHNINASKNRKIPTNFKIPQNNRGYQLMVKVGWDRESGLGPEGSGLKYPIKTVPKKDRKGLGLQKKKDKNKMETVPEKQMNRKTLARDEYKNRRMEAEFRRQFY